MKKIFKKDKAKKEENKHDVESKETVESKDQITVGYYWEVIRRTMNSLCGMSRNEERLIAAKEVLDSLNNSINSFYWNYRVSKDFLEVRNIADVASIIVKSALARKESRGCHFREDFPKTNNRNYLGLIIAKKENKPYILKLKEVNQRSCVKRQERTEGLDEVETAKAIS